MTTAATIINDSLEWLGVSSHIMPVSPAQQQRGFTIVERLFDLLPAKNIHLQMQRPASVSADLREPKFSTEPLVHVVADYLKPYFPKHQLSLDKMQQIKDSYTLLRNKTGKPRRMSYPGGLPRGSGNLNWNTCTYHYPGQTEYQYTLWDERKEGENKIYTADFNAEAAMKNTTVSSVAWSNIGSVNGTISNEALSSNIATAQVDFPSAGQVVLKARATFASGEKYDVIIRVSVVDPETFYRDPDHG